MVANYWDKKAEDYDKHIKKSEKAYLKIIELLKEEISIQQTILDIGTGTGEIPIAISAHVSKIIATDISPKMINVANAKIRRLGISNIIFQRQNCFQMDYNNELFDVIIASNLIHLLERPDHFLISVKKFIKKNGKLILPTFLHNESIKTKVISRILKLKGHSTITKFDAKSMIKLVTDCGYHLERSVLIKNLMPMQYVVVRK